MLGSAFGLERPMGLTLDRPIRHTMDSFGKRKKTAAALAFVLAVAATTYLFATRKSDPLQQSVPPPSTEIDSISPAFTVTPVAPISSTRPGDSIPVAQRSTEERAAAVKHALTLGMGPERDGMAERLVAQGLSRVDGERMAQSFIEGYADCLFDAARKQYEAQGMSVTEFLESAERSWSQLLAAFQLNRVRSAMAPCMANISQQTGVPLVAGYESGGSLDERITPPPPPPPWAAEMDSRIRAHVASRPELGATDVLVECSEEGCSVMLVGRDIRIFDFQFDVFAEQNGFEHALLRGDGGRRFVWLQRR
jgi:hypothetical protein